MDSVQESFTLITKPEQSGKTFVMIQEIKKAFEYLNDNEDNNEMKTKKQVINIIFCDNNLLLTKQTSQRVGNDLSEITIEGEPYIEFSSRKGNLTQNLDSVGYRILMKKTQNIICCTNGRRIQDIQQLIHDFNTGPAAGKYMFNIWLDEADKFIKSISDTFIPLASEFDNFHCYCMTATPDSLFKKFKGMIVMPLHETVRPDYHGWKDNDIRVINFTGSSSQEFVCQVLHTNVELIKPGTKWYIPAETKTITHKLVSALCVSKNMAVFIVNGDGITLQRPGGEKDIVVEKIDELSKQIISLYHEYNLKDKAVAITGNICVSRGISIMSENFMFTHSILYPSSKKSEDSQRAGRIKGNIKEWKIYAPPIVFTTTKFDDIASKWEEKSRKLAIKANEQKEAGMTTYVSKSTWNTVTENYEYIKHPELFVDMKAVQEFFAQPKIYQTAMGLDKPPKPRNIKKNIRDQCGGYAVTSKLLSDGKKVSDLTADQRITVEVSKKIADGTCISSTKGTRFLILPVYDNLNTPPDQEKYEVRYLKKK